MYFVVETLEGDMFHITANTNGFYVNQSTGASFNPNPMTNLKHYKTHSLFELLPGLSNEYKKRFSNLHSEFYKKTHPLETVGSYSAQVAFPWLVQHKDSEYDETRPQVPLLLYGMDAAESLRDWNEELQCHRDLPHTNLTERIMSERTVVRTQAEFVEAAVKGAIMIVNKNVPSFNPFEPFKNQMFVYNNIFFRFAFGGLGQNESMGAAGDYASSGKMVEGVRLINAADVEGLYTLPTVVIDYQGYRVLAHSIVPG
jgi:protein TIF31